jgi:UDP-N-acetylmuramoylalanine--D-glutamate ligase
MKDLANKNVLVLGLGSSGLALARWCVRHCAHVTVADTRPAPPQLQALRDLPAVGFVCAEMNEALLALEPFDMVLKSPGLSPASIAGVITAAQARGIACGNELSLFAQALADLKADRGYAPKVIGVTGTNGKTTVTSLTGQLVQRAGKSVAVAGNIGPTLLDTLAEKLDAEPRQKVEGFSTNEAAEQAVEVAGLLPEPSAEESEQDWNAEPTGDPDAGPDEQLSEELLQNTGEGAALIPVTLPASPVFLALPEVWVLELSSFQLDGVDNFEPTVATVLNVTQDHLDWHGSLPAYAAAKARVYGHGLKLLNRDDSLVMAALPAPLPLIRGKQPAARPYLTFGIDTPQRPGDYGIETVNGVAWLVRAMEADETFKRRRNEEVVLHIQRLMPVAALRIRGRHNATNALAALALGVAAGCSLAPMLHGLREYRGEPHRLESVAVIRDVEYFDDSKGTNVGATVAALAGLGSERKLVVILGGEGKGQDFSVLAEPVSRYAKAVVLIGRDAGLIRVALDGCGVPLIAANSMDKAVELASQQTRTGDAVLMSPACASFDMFDNYEHRGRVFCDAVQALAQEAGAVL